MNNIYFKYTFIFLFKIPLYNLKITFYSHDLFIYSNMNKKK